MLFVKNPRERLRDARNISAYDSWNAPEITQPYTRLILVHIFYYAIQYFRTKCNYFDDRSDRSIDSMQIEVWEEVFNAKYRKIEKKNHFAMHR